MTRKITLAVAALLCSGVLAQYQKAPIPFQSSLDCTSCIRGGYNFCVTIGGAVNNTITTEDCEDKDRTPNVFINNTDPGGVANGYVCSNALSDQMNAIVGACRPYANQNLDDDCGSYFVNLSGNNTFSVGRSILNLPVNSSCTYRAFSTCGYPQVSWRANDVKIAEDFDIAWATMDGLQPSDELDRWNFTEMTDYRGSYASNSTQEYTEIRTPNITKLISSDQWNKCIGEPKNLWVTFTRVKDSDPQLTARTARQL